jgi:hypothetical protein
MTEATARERYEVALERLKQTALHLRQARLRRDENLAGHQADFDTAQRAYDAVLKRLGG